MFALFFLHFVPFFSDWLNFVAQELKPKEKIYLVNKLHASCRLSHSAHIKTLRKTIAITKRCRINGVFLDGPVLLWLMYTKILILQTVCSLCLWIPILLQAVLNWAGVGHFFPNGAKCLLNCLTRKLIFTRHLIVYVSIIDI